MAKNLPATCSLLIIASSLSDVVKYAYQVARSYRYFVPNCKAQFNNGFEISSQCTLHNLQYRFHILNYLKNVSKFMNSSLYFSKIGGIQLNITYRFCTTTHFTVYIQGSSTEEFVKYGLKIVNCNIVQVPNLSCSNVQHSFNKLLYSVQTSLPTDVKYCDTIVMHRKVYHHAFQRQLNTGIKPQQVNNGPNNCIMFQQRLPLLAYFLPLQTRYLTLPVTTLCT